jgi:hypothetical protein
LQLCTNLPRLDHFRLLTDLKILLLMLILLLHDDGVASWQAVAVEVTFGVVLMVSNCVAFEVHP